MNLLEGLNPEQSRAVTHESGPLLIVAGAGTGKTTVITRRIAYLIQEKAISSDHILALTFTEKAAAEMETRVEKLLPLGYADLWISTFHAFCDRVLKEHGLDIGLANDFRLVNETQGSMLVREHLDRFTLDYYKPLGNPTKFIQAFLRHFSRLKDENITPAEYAAYASSLSLDHDASEFRPSRAGKSDVENQMITESGRIQELARAYATYQQILLEIGALDFGDLITYTIKLFDERPKILERYREQFTHILVDEFQDTNSAQYDLIKLLAPPQNNLTVCGDDDQSLYRFRGASVSNIFEFKKDFPDSREVLLIQNYRSPQNILDLAYNFIQLNNPYRLEFQLQNGLNEKASEAKSIHEQIEEKGRPLETRISKKLNAETREKGEIAHLHFETQQDEANGVVKKIIELKNGGRSWNDFAILVRANDHADVFLRSCERAGLPYEFLALRGLFAKPVILDCMAFLRLLDNYHESRAVFRVLGYPMWKIPPIDIHSIIAHANRKAKSVYEAMLEVRAIPAVSEGAKKAVENILTLVDRFVGRAGQTRPSTLILQFLQDSGYLRFLSDRSHEPEPAAQQEVQEMISHLEQFVRFVAGYEAMTAAPDVKGLVEAVNLAQESGDSGATAPLDNGPESVKISTIHGAKGLEFPFVFVVNCVDKRFPSVERREPIEIPEGLVREIVPEGDVHLQEERRLFYVAVTRAREGIYFSSAEDYGGARKKKLSRFLVEAGLAHEAGVKPEPHGNVFFDATPAPKETQAHELPKPATFSYSQINSFRTCPYQYRFAHILHIPVPGKPAFSFGNTIHKTLYEFFRRIHERARATQGDLFDNARGGENAPPPTLDDLLAIYESKWIDDWYHSKSEREEYRKKGREYLKAFYESHDQKFPIPKYLEKGFHLKIGEYAVKGFIDRIDRAGEGIEILDYKTGQPKTEKTADFEQLSIYALAAREVFHEDVRALSYYYIEGNTKVTKIPDEKRLEKVKKELLETIQAIHAGDFRATPNPQVCRRCDFNSICEFSKAR